MSLQDRLGSAVGDRYEIRHELGRGGMATVFLARDLRHDREVAIKVLHPELTHTLGAERFLREIQIAARLHHPHILPLYDSGHAGDLLYYVMPYVEGPSLRERLRREVQLPVEEALRITRQIASALAYADRHGVLHRDIKPENILIQDGYALLADFGVARALDEAAGGKLTQVGVAIGTPLYMSPEQFSTRVHADVRSDLYSLACVLYEMLAGAPPFTGPTTQTIIARHASDPVPPLRTVRPAVPAAVEAALVQALAKVPADRFPDVDSFLQALPPSGTTTPLQTPHGSPSAPAPRDASFWNELKRRKVYQSIVLYIAVGLGTLQAAQAILPAIGVPGWVYQYIVLAVIVGLPMTAVVAWAYDLTKSGFRRNTPRSGTTVRNYSRAEAYGKAGALFALGVLGLVVATPLYFTVLRKDLIPIDLDRAQASRIAESYLAGRGAAGSFEHAIELVTSDTIGIYRERAHTLDPARAAAAGPTWFWRFAWFNYGQERRWSVEIADGGRIVGFRQFLPDSAVGAQLTPEAARPVAEAFLREHGWVPERLDLIGTGTSARVGRTDHTFEWVDSTATIPWSAEAGAGVAVPRITVLLAGDDVVNYSHRLRLPVDFEVERRGLDDIRSAIIFIVLLLLLGLGIHQMVVAERGRQLDWRLGLRFGIWTAAIAVILVTIASLATVEVADTPLSSRMDVLIEGGVLALLVACIVGGFACLLFVAADAVVRRNFPGRMQAVHALLRGDWRAPAVAASVMAGTALAMFMLGVEGSIEAVLAALPGVWTRIPEFTDVSGDMSVGAVLSLGAVAMLVVGIGLGFAVALVHAYTRSTAVAIIIPTLFLAFLSNEVYPVYIGQLAMVLTILPYALFFIRFGMLVLMVIVWTLLLLETALGYIAVGGSGLVPGTVLLAAVAAPPLLAVAIARSVHMTQQKAAEPQEEHSTATA
jgi:hypothetical protein